MCRAITSVRGGLPLSRIRIVKAKTPPSLGTPLSVVAQPPSVSPGGSWPSTSVPS
jgi:hypothetical protein